MSGCTAMVSYNSISSNPLETINASGCTKLTILNASITSNGLGFAA
jgi:hypothetical protein